MRCCTIWFFSFRNLYHCETFFQEKVLNPLAVPCERHDFGCWIRHAYGGSFKSLQNLNNHIWKPSCVMELKSQRNTLKKRSRLKCFFVSFSLVDAKLCEWIHFTTFFMEQFQGKFTAQNRFVLKSRLEKSSLLKKLFRDSRAGEMKEIFHFWLTVDCYLFWIHELFQREWTRFVNFSD